MFGICVESSHRMGMGHLFRALNLIDCLRNKGASSVVFINDNRTAREILESRGIDFETVELTDRENDWESALVRRHGIHVWVNDRLATASAHSRKIKDSGVKLVTFDDTGEGAELADLNVMALPCSYGGGPPRGKQVLSGIEYLVLNKEIARYRRARTKSENIIVSLGGSDTYGVTLKAAKLLRDAGRQFTLHTGPSFAHQRELEPFIGEGVPVLSRVPSLAKAFYGFDLAVTGGGVTPFEANAAGLPAIIIANEFFEIANGKFLHRLGSSIFAGHHEDIDEKIFERMHPDIKRMSKTGMDKITLEGAENVCRRIEAL